MKKIIAILTAVLVLISIKSLQAQQWSDEQKEVWKTVTTYNDLADKRDIQGFLSYFDDSYKGWDYELDAPSGKETIKQSIGYWFQNSKSLYTTLIPAAIWVNGNFAYVHYYYTSATENKEGKVKWQKGRWTDILMKKDGKWVMVGDHGGQTSDDD